MKIWVYILLLVGYLFFVQAAKAEDIHFNNDIYKLQFSQLSSETGRYVNEYYLNGENKSNWSKMIGIYYYPQISTPRKFADKTEKEVEQKENVAILKFIENKKQDKALFSFLENGETNGNKYFEYNIYKYEDHPHKGMMVLRYAKRYFFKTNDEITNIGHDVKKINDDLLEQLIITPIPPIVEKDIDG